MIFDTDIFILIQRGNIKAADPAESTSSSFLPVQTYMELLQGAKNIKQNRDIRGFLADFSLTILPLTEQIGHRASIYVEEYSLAHGIRAGDALIAATATENHQPLSTSNDNHFKPIQDLELKIFKP